MSSKIVRYLIAQNCIKEEDRDLYAYGLCLIAMVTMNIVIAIVLGLFIHRLPYILGFLLCFIPLRSYAGGYHARSMAVCAVVSQLILVAAALIASQIADRQVWVLPFFVLCLGFGLIQIVGKAPSETENKPLSKEERVFYRKMAIMITALETVAAVLCYLAGFYGAVTTVACAVLTESFLLIANGRNSYEV